MQVGDIVKHSGDDGWWMMKDKIGVLIELLGISDPRKASGLSTGAMLIHQDTTVKFILSRTLGGSQ